MSGHVDKQQQAFDNAMVADQILRSTSGDSRAEPFRGFLAQMMVPRDSRQAAEEGVRAGLEASMAPANAIAKAFRAKTRVQHFPKLSDLAKSGAMAKSVLDIGTLTNMAAITGGQSLGYVSLDTQMARGTVRPNSFTMYQCLHKSAAYQVVDYWATVNDTGGAQPGGAFASFGSVSSGTLATSAGLYSLSNIKLALALDGRAVTTALAAQNSYVDIAAQENTNAALTILQTVNWACYWGNPTVYANQFVGLAQSIPSVNQFDYQVFYTAQAVQNGWSPAQTLYNMIYEVAAEVTRYGTFGKITHAFMTPEVNSSLQPLTTTVLNNILTNMSVEQQRSPGMVINGDLQGMRTRFGEIQFPIDLFISARDKPTQSVVRPDGTNPATLVAPTPPVSVAVAVTSGAVSNGWSLTYAPTGAGLSSYVYAVASTDASMQESVLTYSPVVTGTLASGTNTVTITPPAANDAFAFRVFRSGLGYAKTTVNNVPASFRFVGVVLANGATPVTFADTNAAIPGGETIFLLDFAEEDNALDYRYLLPLTRIELFAQNLYMPWAVASIGAIRNRIPKFHALIKNVVPLTATFSPLSPNI
jgi:hypothetical protein